MDIDNGKFDIEANLQITGNLLNIYNKIYAGVILYFGGVTDSNKTNKIN